MAISESDNANQGQLNPLIDSAFTERLQNIRNLSFEPISFPTAQPYTVSYTMPVQLPYNIRTLTEKGINHGMQSFSISRSSEENITCYMLIVLTSNDPARLRALLGIGCRLEVSHGQEVLTGTITEVRIDENGNAFPQISITCKVLSIRAENPEVDDQEDIGESAEDELSVGVENLEQGE